MPRTVGIGIQDFEQIITNDIFYIDKTDFIKEWWENNDEVTLITRPRRFGKTLNLNMLNYFFSNQYSNRGDLFEGLSIWNEEKYRTMQGTYPVINISFADIKSTTYESAVQEIKFVITNLYGRNCFLLEGDILTEKEKEFFYSVNLEMSDVVATRSIQKLCEYLYRYYGKKVIILLDEYDTPMQEAYVNGFWNEIVSFTRSLFNSTFKTNPYLLKGMMTGITRVSKESIFSDLNHLEIVTTTSNKYATSFGFTEEEVFAALNECGLSGEKEEVKSWYDGFIFGKQKDIYNPWSILNFLSKKRYDTYWANSSENRLVSKLIQEGNRTVKEIFERLLNGESIHCSIDEQIVYDHLEESDEAVYSLLLASGYLKVLDYDKLNEISDSDYVMYELALTNREVRRTFYKMVQGWFQSTKQNYNGFIKAMLRRDLEEMNIYMNEVTWKVFSYFDTGSSRSTEQTERFYHGFVLGLLVELQREYILTSNRESGYGRYDVMLEPRNLENDAFIIEFKVLNPRKENTLEKALESALKQIEEKQYEAVLVEKGIAKERIYKYGFAFNGKDVLIGSLF